MALTGRRDRVEPLIRAKAAIESASKRHNVQVRSADVRIARLRSP